jgi:hypothetical protein
MTARGLTWWPFIGCTILLAAYNFMYELYMVGVAGRVKLEFPEQGLRIFAFLMVINTVVCAGLAVVASRWLKLAVPTLVLAVTFTAGGVILAVEEPRSLVWLYASAFLLTLGEVAYGVYAQFLMIRSVPASPRENTIYSGGLVFAVLGRASAASLAFPWVVYAARPAVAVGATVVMAGVSFVILGWGRRSFARLASD